MTSTVFCVSCGHKLAGRYCGQCGGDSQSTADAQSEVPVLTVPAGGAKNLLTHNASKRKGSADASAPKRKGSSAASQRKGSAAGGIGVAQASGQVLENLPAAVASRASGKKSGKVHAGPGRPPAKTYEATDADMRGTRSITEFFGRDQHKAAEGRVATAYGFFNVIFFCASLHIRCFCRAHYFFHARFFCTGIHHSFCCQRCLSRCSCTACSLASCSVVWLSCLGCYVCVWK